jgi:hypothetical protein
LCAEQDGTRVEVWFVGRDGLTGVRKLQAGAGIAASRPQGSPSPVASIEFWMGAARPAPGELLMVPAVSRRLIVAVGFAVIVAGCASGASVAQVKTNPGRYVDKNVTVRGTVTSSWGIPLVPFKMYQVDDGTGEILVLSQSERVPSKGARVKVTGKVGEFAVFGGRSIGLHLREGDLDYDGR